MPLILGDQWLDLGQFPDLVPQRLGVAAREFGAAATAVAGLEWRNRIALIAGNQRPFMLRMALLTATLLARLVFLPRRLAVRVLRAGRQRGVLWRLVEPGFQLRNARQQKPDYRLGFRRLASKQFFRDLRRHALHVAENSFLGQISWLAPSRSVNGYEHECQRKQVG
jgi:hypothetical protein